jgi:cobalt-zinc-cadmium efflux system outer membrane protein
MRRSIVRLSIAALVCVTVAGCGRTHALYADAPYLRYGARPAVTALTVTAVGASGDSDDADDAREGEALVGLDPMVRALLERSPAVAAARERYRAAVESVPQATRLPDLMLEYTWLPQPVETRVGPNTQRVGLRQAIPFPTKLIARDVGARAEARRAALAYDAAVRDQVVELSLAYADLVYGERALTSVSENRLIAATISQLGATRAAQGGGVLFDIARAQAQLAQLDYDEVTLTERRDVARAKVNALLSRPADAPLVVQALPAAAVALTEAALYRLALEHQQELSMLDEAIAAAESRVDLASSEWLPDLSVGAQWMIQGESKMSPAPADSGAEAFAVTFGLSLPWSLHANAGASAAAEARLSAAILDKQAHLDLLAVRVREALFQERNARRLQVLYAEELLPRARAAMMTAEQTAQADSAAYASLLEARSAYYSFTLAYERAQADHFQAVARLERLIGATLTAGADAGASTQEERP